MVSQINTRKIQYSKMSYKIYDQILTNLLIHYLTLHYQNKYTKNIVYPFYKVNLYIFSEMTFSTVRTIHMDSARTSLTLQVVCVIPHMSFILTQVLKPFYSYSTALLLILLSLSLSLSSSFQTHLIFSLLFIFMLSLYNQTYTVYLSFSKLFVSLL